LSVDGYFSSFGTTCITSPFEKKQGRQTLVTVRSAGLANGLCVFYISSGTRAHTFCFETSICGVVYNRLRGGLEQQRRSTTQAVVRKQARTGAAARITGFAYSQLYQVLVLNGIVHGGRRIIGHLKLFRLRNLGQRSIRSGSSALDKIL
jgi:hypothetical protein